MDNLEAVKKILRRLDPDGRFDEAVIYVDAKEICSLFEPKQEDVRFQPTNFVDLSDEENRGSFKGNTKPIDNSRGCSFCGNTLTLLMENREYRLWACQPLKGREGCGRLLLEDAREHIGATWYYAEQNEPDRRRL